jgi:hypothetical protein
MLTEFLHFCHACGAGNTPSAIRCFACNEPLQQQASKHSAHSSPLGQATLSVPSQSEQAMLSVPSQTPSPGPGSQLSGRYQLVREIGQGGFGVVYLAHDSKRRNRPVAVKQINIGKLSAREIIDATDTFNREVTLLGGLVHKRLPRILDHFTDAEHWYLVMSYIQGQTLEDYLQTLPDHRLPINEVIRVGLQVCEVLHYLHTQKQPIIFRDVKPANLMRTPKGEIYLIDFGIARRYAPERTKDTGPLGSPGYAAPEQYGLSQTTALTDIYGLGATLQTLLTGKEPQEAQATDLPLPPAQLSRYVQLRRLLDQMLEKESSKRPRNVEEVLASLESIKNGKKWSGWPYVRGLLWGAGPYALAAGMVALYALVAPFSGSSSPLYPLMTILAMPLLFFWCFWPFVLLGQLIAGCILFFSPRKRAVGLGLLASLALLTLGVLVLWALSGWFPTWPPFFGD